MAMKKNRHIVYPLSNGQWGYVDIIGGEVIPVMYESVWDFEEGLSRVKLNGKYGFIDKTGEEVIPCKYDLVTDFCEGLALVKINKKWGFVDTTGKEICPIKYDVIEHFKEGLCAVCLNGKWGFIDKHGNWYDKMPSTLPESINKITISDIRYMVNECIKRLI